MSDEATGAYEPFPTTHWSLVERAGVPSGQARREALSQLLERYLPALRSYLVRGRRVPPEVCDDVLQSFLARQVLEGDLIGRAEQSRGRFRALLMVSLNNFYATYRRAKRAAERRLPSDGRPEALEGVAAAGTDPADVFDLEWARHVLDQAVERMRRECRANARPDVWGVFEGRVLLPTLGSAEPVPYRELVERYQFDSPAQASNVLVTGTRMFSRILKEVIGQYERGNAEVEQEIRSLWEILSRGGAGSQGLARTL